MILVGDFEDKQRHQVVKLYVAALSLPLGLLILPVNYSGPAHTNWALSPTVFLISSHEDTTVHLEY